MNIGNTNMDVDKGFAAIFVDYENVYYHLRNRYADIPELSDFVIDLLMSLQRNLEDKFGVRSIIAKAYADYERIKSTPQGSLYLMGVETVYVLGTDHKNAADMKLCIDAMEVMYTRPEIETFVLFAGDRDYIPLIQHLKKQAKTVIAVGFEGSFSGDLMTNVGRSNFIDANLLFAGDRLSKLKEMSKRYHDFENAEHEREAQRSLELQERLSRNKEGQEAQKEILGTLDESAQQETTRGKKVEPEKGVTPLIIEEFDIDSNSKKVSTDSQAVIADAGSSVEADSGSKKPKQAKRSETASIELDEFNPVITDLDENERACLVVILRNYSNYHDIFLSPFLRKLSDELPNIADWERKVILGNLEYKGVLRMEKRSGIPYDYTVFVLNYNHPTVREMC